MAMKGIIYGLFMLFLGFTVLFITVLTTGITKIAAVFSEISVPHLLAFLLISVVAMFLATFRWKKILESLGFKLNFLDLFQFNVMGFAIGYITPLGRVGGAPARMIFAEKKGVPMEKGLSSILLDNIIENTFDALFGITIICAFILTVEVPTQLKQFVILGMAGLFTGIVIFYYMMYSGKKVFYFLFSLTQLTKIKMFSWSEKEIKQLDDTFTWFIREKKVEVLRIFSISAVSWVILVIQYKIALLAIGQEVTIFQVLLMMAGLALVAVTPIPAGLGVLEFGQATIFLILGMDPAVGIAFALLIRFRDFFLTTLGSSFLLQYGLASISDGNNKKSK